MTERTVKKGGARKPVSAAPKNDASRKLTVEQYASVNGTPRTQRLVVRALGLRRIRHRVNLPDNPAVRGMVKKIPHLVRIVETK